MATPAPLFFRRAGWWKSSREGEFCKSLLRIVDILQETFDIDASRISPNARLGEDLDIDSIDAIDLIVQLKPLMGSSLDPEAFKSVRTVADVVDAICGMMSATADVPLGA